MEIVKQMPSEKLSGFLDDRFARLLNQACNSLYEKGVLEALRVKYDLMWQQCFYWKLNPFLSTGTGLQQKSTKVVEKHSR